MQDNNKYDIIISGAGAAGLLLAYALSCKKNLSKLKVLLIDPVKKKGNDRTWCFWTKESTPFDSILSKSWNQLEFVSQSFKNDFSLSPYNYRMLRSEDLYSFIWEKLSETESFQFLQAKVEQVEQRSGHAEVLTEKGTFKAEKVFDSRLIQGDFTGIDERYNLILQHFKGYLLETKVPYFDMGKIRMFDFRIPQKQQVRFVYVLPLTERKALVEFTVFSPDLLNKGEYDEVLQKYIANLLNIQDYKILEEEEGIIPMTDFPFKRNISENIFKIGTQGGMCKPSTGYAFLNMWKDAQAIANQLENKAPINLQQSEKRFQYYDALLLDIMKRDGGSISDIFSDMFKNNRIQLIFKFLNEETTLAEDLKIMWSVPSMPFFKSIYNLAKN